MVREQDHTYVELGVSGDSVLDSSGTILFNAWI
jgi:hypothetical protein